MGAERPVPDFRLNASPLRSSEVGVSRPPGTEGLPWTVPMAESGSRNYALVPYAVTLAILAVYLRDVGVLGPRARRGSVVGVGGGMYTGPASDAKTM